MKITITEDQYDKLISSITGEPLKGSVFSKIFGYFKNDSNIGRMVLNAVKRGDYKFDNYGIRNGVYKFEFTINDFPFILTKEKGLFVIIHDLSTPLIEKDLEIGRKIGEELFDILAQKHMDNDDFIRMMIDFEF